MIRFRCRECGKKLKAEEEIIGRKVRCTRCENVEIVPPEDNLAKRHQPKPITPKSITPKSIAPAGKADESAVAGKAAASNEIGATVKRPSQPTARSTAEFSGMIGDALAASTDQDFIANSNPLAADDFADDVDALLGNSLAPPRTRSDGKWSFDPDSSLAPAAEPGEFNIEPKIEPKPAGAKSKVKSKPKFNFDFERRHLMIAGLTLGGLIAAISLVVLIAMVWRSPPVYDPDFEGLPQVAFFRNAKLNLRKSYLALETMAQADVAMGASESADIELEGFKQSFEAMSAAATLDEAYELYQDSQEAKAKMLLSDRGKQMKALQVEIDDRVRGLSKSQKSRSN